MGIDKRTSLERFVDKTRRLENGCLEWTAYRNANGYGKFAPGGGAVMKLAHRWSYEFVNGPIPEGMVIDHLCRNRSCVNPDHLEAVTQAVNIARGQGNGTKTHCPQGHPYAGSNLIVRSGARFCRECRDLSNSQRKAS